VLEWNRGEQLELPTPGACRERTIERRGRDNGGGEYNHQVVAFHVSCSP
jgi:hypothetical protein